MNLSIQASNLTKFLKLQEFVQQNFYYIFGYYEGSVEDILNKKKTLFVARPIHPIHLFVHASQSHPILQLATCRSLVRVLINKALTGP